MFHSIFFFQINNIDVCDLVMQFLNAKKMHDSPLYGTDCEPMKIKFMVKKLSPNQDIPNTKNRKKLAQKLIQVQKEKCSCNHDLNSKFFA